jgi:hypothetical protein
MLAREEDKAESQADIADNVAAVPEKIEPTEPL